MSEDQSSNGSSPPSSRKSWVERLGRAFHGEPRDKHELTEILRDAHQGGVIDSDALAMMEGALEVSEAQVRDAMVPRSQMVVIPRGASLEEFLPAVLESGHSRFPVVGEDRDEVEGILMAKDLLRYFASGSEHFDMGEFLRSASVIPESKRLNMLLRDFRASRNHMAIVVDEYGGVAGLITIEDVLEEIVGEIDDEHDDETLPQIHRVEENRWQIQALTPIEDINEHFECALSDADYDTIGGLLLAEFGRVPEFGETVTLEDGMVFRVTHADSRRINTVELTFEGLDDRE